MTVKKSPPQQRASIVDIITGFSGQDANIVIPRTFLKWCGGDLSVALFLSQCLYWSSHTDHPEGWFARTVSQWEEDTTLTRSPLERAAVILEQVGLERAVKRSQWHDFNPVVHYRFDRNALEIAAHNFFSNGATLNMESTKDAKEKLRLEREKRKSETRSKAKSETYSENKTDSSPEYVSYKENIKEEEKNITTYPPANAVDSASNFSIADEASDDAMFPVSVKGSAKTKSARADKAQTRLAQPTIPPTPLTPAPAKKREKGRFARILDDAWGKGVSGYLLPMLVGTAQKAPWTDYRLDGKQYDAGEDTDDRPMSEAEVYAFGKWYRDVYPNVTFPEKPDVVWQKIVGFRSDNAYDTYMEAADYDVRKLYHALSPAPKQEDDAREIAPLEMQNAAFARLANLFNTSDED